MVRSNDRERDWAMEEGRGRKPKRERGESIRSPFQSTVGPSSFRHHQVHDAAFNSVHYPPRSPGWSLILAFRSFRPCCWGVTQPTAIDLRSLTVALVTFHRFQLFDNPPHHLSTRWSGIKSFTGTRAATWNVAFGVFLASNAIKALAHLWEFFAAPS